jgi:hypothetical protein
MAAKKKGSTTRKGRKSRKGAKRSAKRPTRKRAAPQEPQTQEYHRIADNTTFANSEQERPHLNAVDRDPSLRETDPSKPRGPHGERLEQPHAGGLNTPANAPAGSFTSAGGPARPPEGS